MITKRLYIHIGCHKTGTTSIQHNLAHNADALHAKGLTFFFDNRQTGQPQLPDLHSWLAFVEKGRIVPHGLYVADLDKLTNRLSNLGSDVIVSSENFSFLFEQCHIDALCNQLSTVFEDIRIICYLRRQDRHIISHHQEGSKPFREAEYDLFGHATQAIPSYDPRHELYLNYDRRLSMWAEAFGRENLILKIFDRKLLKDGDVVVDFFHLLGIDDFRKVDDKNISMGFRDIKLGHLINRSDLKHKEILIRMSRSLDTDTRKMIPPREKARAYYEHYIESNKALNSKFRISTNEHLFDEDFSDYPENAQDEWTEETANETVLDLLSLIDRSYASLPADDLRDAAIAVSALRPATALKLLRVAQSLRPNGKLIQQKIVELEQKLKEKEQTIHQPTSQQDR